MFLPSTNFLCVISFILQSNLRCLQFQNPRLFIENLKKTEHDLWKDGRPNKPGNFKVFVYSYSFFYDGKRAVTYFTCLFDWITPKDSIIDASGFMNEKLTARKVVTTFDKTSTPLSLIMTAPMNDQSPSVFQNLVFNMTRSFSLPRLIYLPRSMRN